MCTIDTPMIRPCQTSWFWKGSGGPIWIQLIRAGPGPHLGQIHHRTHSAHLAVTFSNGYWAQNPLHFSNKLMTSACQSQHRPNVEQAGCAPSAIKGSLCPNLKHLSSHSLHSQALLHLVWLPKQRDHTQAHARTHKGTHKHTHTHVRILKEKR